MKVRDVMTSHPVVTGPGEAHAAARAMDEAGVNHLPVVHDARLIGMWVRDPPAAPRLLGPERVAEMGPDDDAGAAMEALMGDAEAVVVREGPQVRGVITRTDALAILRSALGHGLGQRHPRPLVLRLAGPAEAGKSTLIRRTLARMEGVDAVVLQANQASGAGPVEIVDPSVHWRAGLARAVSRLSGAQLVVVEDRDGPPDLARGIGEDVQVAVVPVDRADGIPAGRLDDAQALVLTRCDAVSLHAVQDAIASCAERWPALQVFAVSEADDRDMEAWTTWLRRRLARNRS